MKAFRFERLETDTRAHDDFFRIRTLFGVLSPTQRLPSDQEITEILSDPKNHVWIVREKAGGGIVGMATLTVIKPFSPPTAIINDVVVDPAYRGNALGRHLTEVLIAAGEAAGAVKIILSSNPDNPARASARALYESLDFVPSTNGRWMVRET